MPPVADEGEFSLTSIRRATLTIPTSMWGPSNPLPNIFGSGDIHAKSGFEDAEEDVDGDGVDGRSSRAQTALPYLEQDGYQAREEPQEHPTIVLENEHLTATFLPGLGGRLWSLFDRATGRELLHQNEAIRFRNLALRNAWFAGGVEWNIGMIGHSPFTSSRIHTAALSGPDGEVGLRFFEYERIRNVSFRVDAWLPDDSHELFIRGTIVNDSPNATPMYWWSNMAVPQLSQTRVLAPAASAWKYGRERVLSTVPVPLVDGVDISWPARTFNTVDYFFDTAGARVPWISAVNGTGFGLVQASTANLKGRKLFVWGQDSGGRHWQEWVSGADSYCEIQAGLARTQLEYLRMPAETEWSWVEAYWALHLDVAAAASDDWAVATGAVAADLASRDLPARLEAVRDRDQSRELVVEVVPGGSGWGAVENELRLHEGRHPIDAERTPFPADAVGADEEYWLRLLRGESATAAELDPLQPPRSYQIDERWVPLLRQRDDWLALLHLGVIAAAQGSLTEAGTLWRASVDHTTNAWALRNLGALAVDRGNTAEAVPLYLAAHELVPGLLPLTRELLTVLLSDGRTAEALALIESLPSEQRGDGRVLLAEARSALAIGDLDRCRSILERDLEILDLREGDALLEDVWNEYQAALATSEPLPSRYDFRM
jgi:tetratricopeptide (TPR) repeat protein